MLLRFRGSAGRSRVPREIELPLADMSDEWIQKIFFILKKEGMRRGLLSRYGYRKRKTVLRSQDGRP